MSVTSYGRSFKMTALNDERAGFLKVTSIELAGTGMTPTDHLTIAESSGAVVVDHYIENANENKEFVVQPFFAHGLKLAAVPAAGTWAVVVRFG